MHLIFYDVQRTSSTKKRLQNTKGLIKIIYQIACAVEGSQVKLGIYLNDKAYKKDY